MRTSFKTLVATAALALAPMAAEASDGPRIAVVSRDGSPFARQMADVLDHQGYDVTRSPRKADVVIEVRTRDIRADQRVRDRDYDRKRLGNWFGGRPDGQCGRMLEARYEKIRIDYRLDYAVDIEVFDSRGRRIDRDQVRERARADYVRIDNLEVVDACGRVDPGSVRSRDLDRLIERSREGERRARQDAEYAAAETLARKAVSELHMAQWGTPYRDDRYRDDRYREDRWSDGRRTTAVSKEPVAAVVPTPAPSAAVPQATEPETAQTRFPVRRRLDGLDDRAPTER